MATRTMNELDWDSVRQHLIDYGQEHILHHLDDLTSEQQTILYRDIMELNLPQLSNLWGHAKNLVNHVSETKDDKLKPLDKSIMGSTARDKALLPSWRDIGLEKIASNQVAVLLLAGGQGTRLNVSYPKGMYNVGLPSGKSLYQLQAERILCLQKLAQEKFGRVCIIPWYIMTSEHTMAPTRQFFETHKYFGLLANNVHIFEQSTLPCLDFTGKIFLSEKHRIARAPDGNGGLYTALAKDGNTVLTDMKERGITCVHVYCVDNILVRMADPVFIGFCCDKKAECGAKVVKKVQPTERVGVVCCYDDHYEVVEYSEISTKTAEQRSNDGTLTYNAGNIANHFFTREFLERICRKHIKDLCHHVAKKKIPFINKQGELEAPSEPNGIKLEKFIFDVFAFTRSFSVLEVLRDEEFSPVKNAPGAAKDTPDTAKQDLFRLHHRLVVRHGGRVVDKDGKELAAENGLGLVVCEISPLVSYCGEGLDSLCAGQTFTNPVYIGSDK